MHFWAERLELRLAALFFAALEPTFPKEIAFFDELRGDEVPLKFTLRAESGVSPRVEPDRKAAFGLVGVGRLRELLLYRSGWEVPLPGLLFDRRRASRSRFLLRCLSMSE